MTSKSVAAKDSANSAELIIHGFRLCKAGLHAIGMPSYEDWQRCGLFLHEAEQSIQFWIGDWLNYGEKRWGQRYREAIEQTGLEYQTLRDYKWVASKVPLSYRNDKLSYHHHREVASLPPETQSSLLTRAASEDWSLVKLKQEKHRGNLEAVRSGTVIHDPDWMRGDCVKLLANLPDNSIDLLLTDPPYGIEYESAYREVELFEKLANDTLADAMGIIDQALAVLKHKLKPNSHAYIFTNWRTYPALVKIVEKHLSVKNLLIWEKNNWTMGDLDANYGNVHEGIVFADNYESVLFAHKGRRFLNGKREGNILHFDRALDNGRLHPTEKPLPLLQYLIEKSSKPGEVVCDPFGGVASTCLAAHTLGRKYIGMEVSERWHTIGLERLSSRMT